MPILKIKIIAVFLPVCFEHPILQIICFTDIKVRLYASDMLLNRKGEKKYVKVQKFDFFRKQNGENLFFLVQMFYSLKNYLASIIF